MGNFRWNFRWRREDPQDHSRRFGRTHAAYLCVAARDSRTRHATEYRRRHRAADSPLPGPGSFPESAPMNGPDLGQLHDFYQPPPPSWVPQTIGWYVLFALLFAGALFLMGCALRRW